MAPDTFSTATVALMRARLSELGDDPEQALRLTMRLAAAFHRMFAHLRHTLGVSPSEMAALMAMWDGGRCTMSALGDRMGLSRAGVTTLVDRVEAIGLFARTPDPADRRRVLLSVTPKFEVTMFRALAQMDSALTELAREDPDSWQTFAGVADAVREAAGVQADDLFESAPKGPRPTPVRRKAEADEHW